MKKFFKSAFFKIIILIIVFVVGNGTMFSLFYFFPTKTESITNINKLEKEVTVTDEGIADAVDKVYDATVVITSSKGDTAVSSGSGFVYKTDDEFAYIITNNHVVANCNAFTVTFANQELEKATLVGGDQFSDIAVLKVSKDRIIKIAEIGSSTEGRVGDTVFAVGAPLDSTVYSFSVTRGILSGKDRYVEVALTAGAGSDWVMKVLQTDTAINSGNSGGPLVNSNGQVIGVTNMKLMSSGVEGMGFAITIEDAVNSANDIIDGKTIEKPYLGISMYNAAYAYYGYVKGVTSDRETGVYVSEVQAKSCSDKAGILAGDIIIGLDEQEIKNVANLRYYLYKHKVGDKVKIKVYRDNEEKNIELKIEAK